MNNDDIQSQHNRIREAFNQQAADWGKSLRELTNDLTNVAAALDLKDDYVVLDVASGTGLLSEAIAPHVDRVIAVDITPAMMQQAQNRGIENNQFTLGAAERLPYAPDTFDRVVTRYSLHHMVDPQVIVYEMYRVCRLGGQLMVMDLAAPEDSAVAEVYNHLERVRDPSHTMALSLSSLEALFKGAGFNQINHSVGQLPERDLEGWFDLAQTPEDQRQIVRDSLQTEVDGGSNTGFNAGIRDGSLTFRHTLATVIGTK